MNVAGGTLSLALNVDRVSGLVTMVVKSIFASLSAQSIRQRNSRQPHRPEKDRTESAPTRECGESRSLVHDPSIVERRSSYQFYRSAEIQFA